MSLFSLTESIVNIPNEEEARNQLLNSNVLLLNNQEYYKTIISSFIQKKESIIRKENNRLVFDLNNTDDIWNIVFIGEYIKENDILYKTYNKLLLKIDEIECALSLIKDKHKTATSKETHQIINEEYQNVNNVLREYKNQLDNMKSVIDAFYNTDWVELINSNESIDSLRETKVLKQAINIIHKVRNSFEHDNPNVDSNIHISNDSFDFSIPIEYLDGFNKGRIIANNNDSLIVERTNMIAMPLLEELNCDINNIQSLFYNIDPELLSMLLKEANYNIKDIFRLSKRMLFEQGERTKKILEAGFGIDIIEKIWFVIEWDLDLTTEEIIKTLNYLKSNNLLDKYILTNPSAYYDLNILDLFIKNDIDSKVIDLLSNSCFTNIEYARKLVDEINLLRENGISFSRLIKRFSKDKYADKIPYDYAEDVISLKKYFNDNNISLECLYDENVLRDEFFKNPNKFKGLLNNNNMLYLLRPIFWYASFPDNENKEYWIVDFLKENNIDLKQIGMYGDSFEKFKSYLIEKELYPFNEENNQLYIVLEYLRVTEYLEKNGYISENVSIFECISKLVNAGINIEDIDSLSRYAIEDYESIIFYMNNNISFDVIKNISDLGLVRTKSAIELLNYLKENNLSYDLIKRLFMIDSKSVIKLLEGIPKDKREVIKRLSVISMYDTDGTISNINYLIENNIDIFKVAYNLIEGGSNTKKFIEWFKSNNYDLKTLENLPYSAFLGFNIDFRVILNNASTYEEFEKYNSQENRDKALKFTMSLIELFINHGYTSDKVMPKKIFLESSYKKENLEYLLKLVNYDFEKLDEFPSEFYTCDYELLDSMCKNYNYNLCKSIFGLDNPKVIVSLIYGNSVYSQYQKEFDDYSLIDIDPITIIHAGFNTTMYYKDNIKNSNFDDEAYLKQFMYDENNHMRTNEELKKYLLDKLRNSLAHFRFKPVLDKDDNIVNDKVYIYDSYDESSENNFDLILDIKDFVELTRQVELGLLKKQNEIAIEDNRFKSR